MSENLESYCLKTIVDEFERYFLSFSTSEDRETQRKFEFLQRKYSFDILSRLFTEDEMQDKYIDFLINKYLKVLDTRWFSGCSWDTVIEKFVEIGSNIEKIYIHDIYLDGSYEETPWNDIIEFLPNLKCASFFYDCSDKILKSIAEFCPNILEIDLSDSSITNDGIKNLCMEKNGKRCCTKLKKLSIASTQVKEEGVKYLIKKLPSLEVIVYPDLPGVLHSLHKDDLSTLDDVKPYNITSLDLLNFATAPFYNDLLKVCLTVCPRLKCLTCPFLTEENLNVLSKLINLEKLNLQCYSDSAIDINTLLKLKGLKLSALTVFNCIISLSIVADSCPRLKELYLNKVKFLCTDDLKFAFQSLESCVFDNAANDSATFKAVSLLFSSSPNLESVTFKLCVLSSEMKRLILKCCGKYPIKKLSFCGSDVDMEFLKEILLNCRSLKYLNLEACDIEEDETELYQFAEILPNNPHICFSDNFSFSDDYDYDGDLFNDYDYDFDDDLEDDDYYHSDYLFPSDYEDDSDDYVCYFES